MTFLSTRAGLGCCFSEAIHFTHDSAGFRQRSSGMFAKVHVACEYKSARIAAQDANASSWLRSAQGSSFLG